MIMLSFPYSTKKILIDKLRPPVYVSWYFNTRSCISLMRCIRKPQIRSRMTAGAYAQPRSHGLPWDQD